MEQVYDYVSLAAACGEKPSFSTLVTERFYNDLVAEIDEYNKRQKTDICPISIRKVIVTNHDIDEQNLYFDALVNCVLNDSGIEKPITMIVDAYFDLNEEFKAVHTRCAVPMWKGFRSAAVLPDDLIPVISKKDMDAIAFRMSNALNPRVSTCGALLRPCQAVKGLGLTVEDVHFDSDGEILAKIFFEDARTMVIDPQTGIRHIIPVSAGTILVNNPVGKVLDERIRNNTIMHECIHWMLHRPAFLLAKLWNHEYSAIACRRTSSNSQSRQWTAIDRMEWQANALAPRILMPNWATQLFASGWLRRYSWLSPILRMEKTIDQLSRQFNVSRQLAKIRMEELGYEDAKAAFSYYDKRKHTISFENAARELARNKAFRDTLETGIYAYVDNCFVIRDSKYIYRDDTRKLHLTSFAKAHLDECCLAFISRRINRGMQYGMLRYNVEDETFITGSETTPADLAKKTNSIMGILQSLPASFSDTLIAHMKRKGFTVEQLAESSLVSDRQIYRFRKAPYPNITLPQVVGLCIGLKLHPILSCDLIKKAGYSFNMSPQHKAYHMLILTMSNNSIYECNDYLTQVGIAPIGKEE